jgi:hypothetical protein
LAYDRPVRRSFTATLVLLVACNAESPAGAPAMLDDAPVVTAREAPAASDARPQLDVVWHDARFSSALGVVRAADAIYVTDADHVLWRVDVRDRRERVADGVAVPPIASDDGAALAWVEDGGTLVVRENGVSRVAARELASCAPLRFSPDRAVLAFAGVSHGGVAALYTVARGEAPVCRTNCTLVTGRPWGSAFVPLPDPAALRFDEDGAPR